MMKRWMYGTVFLAFISVYSNPFDCDFEKDPCSWSLEGFRRISYNQSNSTGGMNDDKPRNGKEWYIYCDATNESYATLTSKPTTINGLQCLNFWYRFRGQDKSQIQVIVQDIGGGNDYVIWEKSDVWNTSWFLATAEIDIQTSSMVTILIRGKTGRSHSKIEIDDIVVKLASCLDCNFLDGLCSWKGNGCTFETDEFNHVLCECKSPSYQSTLSSDVEISPGEKCLSFKYQTKDFQRENVYIDVQSYYEKQWSTVWKSGWQEQFQGWKEIGAEMILPNKSSITIRFVHRNCSNMTYYISSISLKKQSCTESKTTFAEFPTSIGNVTVIDTTVAISTADRTVTTSTYSANDELVIGIVIVCLALTVAVLLVAVYLYRRRRATSHNANTSKNSTVSSGTFVGASRTNTDNRETRHSTERLTETSETVSYYAQAEYSTRTQPLQSSMQQGFITDVISIYPWQVQLLNKDGNNVTNPVPTYNQYHQSADTEGTNSYDIVNSTYNHTTEFRVDTYDSTIKYPKTIPDTTYDHTNFKQNFDNTYDHANPTQVHTCDTTIQRPMQDFDPTYDYT